MAVELQTDGDLPRLLRSAGGITGAFLQEAMLSGVMIYWTKVICMVFRVENHKMGEWLEMEGISEWGWLHRD